MHAYQPFTKIERLFGAGQKPPSGWIPVTEANLTILVGVTGVGKSRTIEELANLGLNFTLLPNRRVLTDHLIIATLQQADGLPTEGGTLPAVRDRKERFAYTRRYRELYSGGMAQALTNVWFAPETASSLTIFDGLRGTNEVSHAAQQLPQARFIALCAPDGVRVQRLLGRNEAFDQIETASPSSNASSGEPSQSSSGTSEGDTNSPSTLADHFPDAADLRIGNDDEKQLLAMLRQGILTTEEVAAKLAIVAEERRNYDPDATLATLQASAPERLCIVDTVVNGPEACAQQIKGWLDS